MPFKYSHFGFNIVIELVIVVPKESEECKESVHFIAQRWGRRVPCNTSVWQPSFGG